eukprot:scaffold4151_cov106-Isochrysis_galbana.AAC.1
MINVHVDPEQVTDRAKEGNTKLGIARNGNGKIRIGHGLKRDAHMINVWGDPEQVTYLRELRKGRAGGTRR